MKVKMLLPLFTLVIGALMILAAQSVPEYHDDLLAALPILAVIFSLVLMVLEIRKRPKMWTVPTTQKLPGGPAAEPSLQVYWASFCLER